MYVQRISSAEFRKSYGKLTEPTIVTVNGRPIGTWYPSTSFTVGEQGPEKITLPEGWSVVPSGEPLPPMQVQYHAKPFTPAPKPKRKR